MTAASAYSPQATEQGSPEVRSQEPSMEDILASIRRIIADDQSQGTRPGYGNGVRRAAGQTSTPEAEKNGARARTAYDDVLDLARLAPAALPNQKQNPADDRHDTSQRASEAVIDELPLEEEPERSVEPTADVPSSLRARMPEPASQSGSGQGEGTHLVAFEEDASDEALLSEPLGASVMSAFETLAATVVLQNTPMLEGVMRDLLRPLLKTWLDDNLPALVERLVRIEIERVARGPRS